MSKREEHQELVQRAFRLREDIQLLFADALFWNEHVRKTDEAPIDPDPEGELAANLKYLEEFLASSAETEALN